MSSVRQGRTGRRSGDSGTRDAILGAARERFGSQGYTGASIRSIAAAAGVDPALVHHFFGTKERLFTAAMSLPVVPSEAIDALLAAERARLGPDFADHLGEVLVRGMLMIWGAVDIRAVFLGLLRSSATNDQAVDMLREFITGTVLGVLERSAVHGLSPAERRFRAALVASQIVGLGFTRYVLRLEPMASAPAEDLVAAVGPTLQRYLTGGLAASPGT